MTDNILVDLSMDFSVDIVKLCESIKGKSVLTNQILRSGTSVGANIHEANYARLYTRTPSGHFRLFCIKNHALFFVCLNAQPTKNSNSF